MLILEPSKVLQPAIVCVSEEDESRTVQLKHVTPLKVCRPSVTPPPRQLSKYMLIKSLLYMQKCRINCIVTEKSPSLTLNLWDNECLFRLVCSASWLFAFLCRHSYMRTIAALSCVMLCASAVSLSLSCVLTPSLIPQKGLHQWTFPASAIRGVR